MITKSTIEKLLIVFFSNCFVLFCIRSSGQNYNKLDFSNHFNFNISNGLGNGFDYANLPTGNNVVFNSVPYTIYPLSTSTLNGWNANVVGGSNPIILKIPCNAYIKSVRLLSNTAWGAPGPTSYASVQLWHLNTLIREKYLIGNNDIRDYNQASWTNIINNDSTTNAWTSSSGNTRLDEINIGLSSATFIDTIRIVDNGASGISRIFVVAATVENGTSLPLKLINFYATLKANETVLQWQTSQEQNTDVIIIERSANQSEYQYIGKVIAAGNSSSNKNYSFIDKEPFKGTNFYRLRMVDKDGKFTYSKIVSLKINTKAKAAIFPNPVKSITTIQLQSEYLESVAIKVVGGDGKILSTKNYKLIAGNNLISLNTERLTTGVYTLVVVGQNINEHLTFSKQ